MCGYARRHILDGMVSLVGLESFNRQQSSGDMVLAPACCWLPPAWRSLTGKGVWAWCRIIIVLFGLGLFIWPDPFGLLLWTTAALRRSVLLLLGMSLPHPLVEIALCYKIESFSPSERVVKGKASAMIALCFKRETQLIVTDRYHQGKDESGNPDKSVQS